MGGDYLIENLRIFKAHSPWVHFSPPGGVNEIAPRLWCCRELPPSSIQFLGTDPTDAPPVPRLSIIISRSVSQDVLYVLYWASLHLHYRHIDITHLTFQVEYGRGRIK